MKLEIAKKLRKSVKTESSENYKKLAKKCYRTYVIECLLKRKHKYQMKFASTPDEWVLYYIIEKCGLKITDEHFIGRAIVYDVAVV